ncbi:hypothetical protein Agub_g7783 [Astrephomene gubernaculifera]|uniref:Uncharacterized protein n=1 Tax=Astrephomene gubernaculifera TaxID=47775 RepID=A0AAD3HMJ1_9CHLO|nr:hypothetical protein Agub_g7783 [Astrephomene gubernaculifera]
MAYWGYKTPANFAVWVLITVLLVTGVIWLPKGGADTAGCGYCWTQFDDGPLNDMALINSTKVGGIDKGCLVAAFSFNLYEPEEAAKVGARDDFYWFCLNSGPLAQMIGGAVVFGVGLLLLTYFCCCAVKPSSAGTAPV